MKYLLDTHALIWYLYEPEKLSKDVYQLLQANADEMYVSAINFWEISIKSSNNKIDLKGRNPKELYQTCVNNGFLSIEVSISETISFYQLTADFHRDPFDRMLIWQALQNNLTIITNNTQIEKYKAIGLKTIW